MRRLRYASLSVALVALPLSHCGSSHDTGASGFPGPDAGAGGTSDVQGSTLGPGLCDGSAHASAAPPVHRALPQQCSTTPVTEAGATDRCLVDADCPDGLACTCKAELPGIGNLPGSGVTGNACFSATCHLDTDCGAGQYCTLNLAPGAVAWTCTTAEDTCRNPSTDCACLPGVPSSTKPACMLLPEVGHFVCAGPVAAG